VGESHGVNGCWGGGGLLAELFGVFLGDVMGNRHDSLLFEFRFTQAMLLIDVTPGNSQP
jgi:hypothetical protein